MNKELFQEWSQHPITKHLISSIKEAEEEIRSRSKIRDTIDQTAIECIKDESFCEGLNVFVEHVEDMKLELKMENDDELG